MSLNRLKGFMGSAGIIMLIMGVFFLGTVACNSEEPNMDKDFSSARDKHPDATDQDIEALSAGNSEFALELYHEMRKSADGNLFYSPYSISLALAMTYAGARGETEEQMAGTLHYTLPQDNLHRSFNFLDHILESRAEPEEWSETGGFKLNIANSLWGQEGYKFLPEFTDLLGKNYGAGLRTVDFAREPDASVKKINQWVEEKTEDKIQDLLSTADIIPELTRLILVNAIYFNASWALPFEEDLTEDDYFNLPDGDRVLVPMMRQTEYLRHRVADGYKAVMLPYNGRDLGMLIIMPDEGEFEKFEKSFDTNIVNELQNQMSNDEVRLTMPKFAYESSFRLTDALANMGMPSAFGSQADFSGMDGTHELFIGNVIHKAVVDVDEEGTEAAAATAVVMFGAAEMAEPEPVVIRIDRPFIFLIRDFQTGTILFVGRVLNPVE